MGDPGVGKSSVVKTLAAAQQVPCEIVLGTIRDPADIGGYPRDRGDDEIVLIPGRWAKRLRDAGRGYLFLDELTTCPPAVQGAMLSVVLDKKVGDLELPKDVIVVAGANPPGAAAGGYELEPPLANRFCHIPFAPSTDEWLDGMATGWAATSCSRAVAADEVATAAARACVLGFIKTNPTLLDGFAQAEQTSGPWASRRTWDMLARALAHVRADDTDAAQTLAFGLVGPGTGQQFLSWRKDADLPDPDAVVADPGIFDWANAREDRVYAVLTAVTAWATSRQTAEAWRSAWKPVVAAARAGRVDVAAVAARTLAQARPANAVVPKEVREFAPVLKAAGITKDRKAAA
ncbi:AAA family ATPase [Nocardia transvalensis]|uniref:AAA family ATPase n=1 Tax=Nocardia transvalensis TaxID=37333 RepID=UPI002B4B0A61|nr:AAA family ATPase [Nocardia transvalensis]